MKKSDGQQINDLIERFYNVFNNRDGHVPNFSVLDDVFIDEAVIFKRSDLGVQVMSLKDFRTPREALFVSGALKNFHEWEVGDQTIIKYGLASRVSEYQKDGLFNDQPYNGVGIKHFQLLKTQSGWKITSVVWQDIS